MPRSASQTKLGRAKRRAAAYFRRVALRQRKQRKAKPAEITLRLAAMDTSKDLNKLMNQAVKAYKEESERIDIASRSAARMESYGAIGREFEAQKLNQIASILEARNEQAAMLNELEQGLNQTRNVIGMEAMRGNNALVNSLTSALNRGDAQTAASLASATDRFMALSSQGMKMDEDIRAAEAEGNAQLAAQLKAQREQIKQSLKTMKEGVEKTAKEEFDKLSAQLNEMANNLTALAATLSKAINDTNELNKLIKNVIGDLSKLPPGIFDPKNKGYLYFCSYCHGAQGAGASGCATEQNENAFYNGKAVQIYTLPDIEFFKNQLVNYNKEWYDEPDIWKTVDGPIFQGERGPSMIYNPKDDTKDYRSGFKLIWKHLWEQHPPDHWISKKEPGPAGLERGIEHIVQNLLSKLLDMVAEKARAAAKALSTS